MGWVTLETGSRKGSFNPSEVVGKEALSRCYAFPAHSIVTHTQCYRRLESVPTVAESMAAGMQAGMVLKQKGRAYIRVCKQGERERDNWEWPEHLKLQSPTPVTHLLQQSHAF